ncbi:MAG: sulfatase [Acidobacteriia bacterium]|nr:sulfatase [Terriglobia bacterium]MYG04878.1 sulfatase [Terriglobia bacterium]
MQDLVSRSALTRRRALQSFAGGAAAFLTRCGGSSAPRPNILLVMTDDQQHSQMSCAGHPLLQTPNMDRLASEGARFANAYCTNSLCAPGRATVLTGCYSHVHGIRGNSEKADAVEELDPSLPTFPQLLQQAGYRTGLVGKWHLRQQPRGFDEWKVLPGQGVYFDPDFIANGQPSKESGYATDITTDFALDFLRRGGPGPFCLLYQHKAPHRPFTPAPRHAGMFADSDWPKPSTYDDDYGTRRVAAEARDMRFEVSLEGDYPDLPPGLSPAQKREWIYQRFAKDHHRAVYGVDEGLGRVLDYLDTSGLAEDTLVLYTTDNGYFIGEHGWYDKRFMYEPALRVPLLVRYPRLVAAAQVEDRPAVNIDIAPTLLDFAGVDVPEQMQGRSLRPLLEGSPPDDWRDSILYSYYENSWAFREMAREQMTDPSFQYWTPHRVGPHRGVRTDRYKLIEYYGEGDYWELFDLHEDPDEVHNLYTEPGHADLIQELQAELARLRDHYGERG